MVVLFVVSCEKNELGEDNTSSINVIEQPNELDALSNIDIDGLINRLVSTTRKNGPKKGLETAKDAVAGSSYIQTFSKVETNNDLYEIAFDDTRSGCNPADSGLSHITLTLESNGDTAIRVGDQNGTAVVTLAKSEVDLSFLYGIDINQGVKIDGTDGTVTKATVSGNNSDYYTFN